jgi:YHS domain-containing protein
MNDLHHGHTHHHDHGRHTGHGHHAKHDAQPRVKDPVCGMMVDSAKAKDHTTDGVKYYFCSDACHDAFEKAPGNYAGKTGAPEGKAAEQAGVKDFVCGMMVEKKEAHTHTHGDVKYYFCSDACEDTFKKDPATYINKAR